MSVLGLVNHVNPAVAAGKLSVNARASPAQAIAAISTADPHTCSLHRSRRNFDTTFGLAEAHIRAQPPNFGYRRWDIAAASARAYAEWANPGA